MKFFFLQQRIIIAIISSVLGVVCVLSLHFFLEQGSSAARLLLDYRPDNDLYPLTVQNVMWIVFFLGLGELWCRLSDGRAERSQLHKAYLPEDEQTLLQQIDIVAKNIDNY